MRFIPSHIHDILFSVATTANWIGRVQAVSTNRECVPMIIEGAKYMLEFSSPAYFQAPGNFEEIFCKKKNGENFLPMLEHRLITFWFDVERSDEDGIKPICEADHVLFGAHSGNLADMLHQAFMTYFETHPQVAQYFFVADVAFATFVHEKILTSANPANLELNVVLLSDIAAPRYGFEVARVAGRHHG